MSSILSHARLVSILSYEPSTGDFRWKIRDRTEFKTERAFRAFVAHHVDNIAGSSDGNGYVQIRIDGKKYRAHRVAWFYVHGQWPDDIDHLNGNRSDNRISNLRSAGVVINNQNERRARTNNVTGLLGVHRSGNRFQSHIRALGIKHYLGTFVKAGDAHEAYLTAKRQLHEGNTL